MSHSLEIKGVSAKTCVPSVTQRHRIFEDFFNMKLYARKNLTRAPRKKEKLSALLCLCRAMAVLHYIQKVVLKGA